MKQTETKERTFSTTTIVIDPITDYSLLEKKFRLIRYLIPGNLKFVYKKNLSILFGRIHNAFRDQVGAPYRSYTFDKLDGDNNIQWAFYVMYPRQDEIFPVSLPWYQNEELKRREIRFHEPPRHVLIKLLQIRFCHANQTGRFVGQDKCYVYADSDFKKDIHVCAEIEIKGAPTNREGPYEQEFRVIAHARRFVKATPPYNNADALFAKHPIGNKLFFSHLKQSALQKEANVYRRFTSDKSRAHLMYHNTKRLDAGRGKIVYDFIPAFLEDLAVLGISGHIRKRTFRPASSPDTAFLPTENLHTVGVFDNRLDKTHPLSAYVDLFNTSNSTVQFIPLSDLSLAPRGGAFVLLDARAEDFKEDGILDYDTFLKKEVEPTHPALSFNELTESEEWVEYIAKIFGSKKTAPKIIRGKLVEGKYHCRLIIGIYQDLDKFLSEKGQEVHLYQGIWYDETNAFTVGSPTGMNIEGQDKANPIRRFQILQGADHFDKEQVLSTMGVKFVRFNQYTVSPYYFHLIDVYVESILSHSE